MCRAPRAGRAARAVSSPGRENGSHNDDVDGDNAASADSTEQKDQQLGNGNQICEEGSPHVTGFFIGDHINDTDFVALKASS